MKEKPIIFNTEMVKAILNGRKTQTRRPIKHQNSNIKYTGERWVHIRNDNTVGFEIKCPFGKVGDKIWVRETFCNLYIDNEFTGRETDILYKADPEYIESKYGNIKNPRGNRLIDNIKWKPSIHMPKTHARIWLEIKNIRLERLQDIKSREAMAEGIERTDWIYSCSPYRDYSKKGKHFSISYPPLSFKTLWDSVYKDKYHWDNNPFVWVIDFKWKTIKH